MLHLLLHLLVPLGIALAAYKPSWLRSYAVLMAGMLIDLDHLLANPIYDPNRCSIGFHPLHQSIPIAIYILALAHPKTRLPAIGLCVHIVLDALDCQYTNGIWYTP